MGFEESEVEALLGPEGLWWRVVGLERNRVEELIKDEKVAADIRKRIGGLRKIISSTPHLWVKRIISE